MTTFRQTNPRTNVRTLPPVVRPVIQGTFRTVRSLSPGLASRMVANLFLTPRRHPVPRRERRWTENANSVQIASTAGQTLRCLVWGPAGAPTVLLVHGWEGRASQLGAFVEPLLQSGLRVVALDHPGHGASSGKRSSLPEMAAAIEDVARTLTGPLHALIAHSLGAAAATLALSRGVQARRAVFIAGPAGFDGFMEEVARILGLGGRTAEEAQRVIEERFGLRWRDIEARTLAPALRVPMLFVHDREDREIPFRHAQELATLWPSSRLVATEGLGHRRILRDEKTIALVARFLAPRFGELANPTDESRAA